MPQGLGIEQMVLGLLNELDKLPANLRKISVLFKEEAKFKVDGFLKGTQYEPFTARYLTSGSGTYYADITAAFNQTGHAYNLRIIKNRINRYIIS